MVDPVTLETSLTGVFAGGDVVLGPSSVVEAIASGKRAAASIDRYLKGIDLKARREQEKSKVGNTPKEGMKEKARQMTPLLSVRQRSKNFREVKTGFSEEIATNEARRCMNCGSKAYIAYPEDCMTCFDCELMCPSGAVYVHPLNEVLPFTIKY
jgi:NAD-dependent dihydropyrimidine dehydrogenase PreA subunit